MSRWAEQKVLCESVSLFPLHFVEQFGIIGCCGGGTIPAVANFVAAQERVPTFYLVGANFHYLPELRGGRGGAAKGGIQYMAESE